MKFIYATLIAIGLSGCAHDTLVVQQYQELQIVHQDAPRPLELRNPSVLAMTGEQLAEMGNLSDNKKRIFYIMDATSINEWLLDDVDKLEYAQRENLRAEFYKKAVTDFNAEMKKKNEESKKKLEKDK